jgi:hypothetical protein
LRVNWKALISGANFSGRPTSKRAADGRRTDGEGRMGHWWRPGWVSKLGCIIARPSLEPVTILGVAIRYTRDAVSGTGERTLAPMARDHFSMTHPTHWAISTLDKRRRVATKSGLRMLIPRLVVLHIRVVAFGPIIVFFTTPLVSWRRVPVFRILIQSNPQRKKKMY